MTRATMVQGFQGMADNKYVVFKLASELYGIAIERVERILPEQQVTRLPRTPKMFLGVFDLRGETVPAVDLRTRFEMEATTEPSNFIVVLTESGRCALRADGVSGIVPFDEKDIEANPDLFDRKGDEFIQGIGKFGEELVVILEPDEIVPKTLRAAVSKAQKAA